MLQLMARHNLETTAGQAHLCRAQQNGLSGSVKAASLSVLAFACVGDHVLLAARCIASVCTAEAQTLLRVILCNLRTADSTAVRP